MRPSYTEYIKEHISEYLPEEYHDFDIDVTDVIKGNHIHLTGLHILGTDGHDQDSPVFYLEEYRERIERGESLETIMEEIAGAYVSYKQKSPRTGESTEFSHYESVRDQLIMRLCDPETSNDLLADVPWTSCGELAVTYRLRIPCPGEQENLLSATITNELADIWGVTPEQLHEDATIAENKHNPAHMYPLLDMFSLLVSGEPRDMFETGVIPPELSDADFLLTDTCMLNGASVIAREDVLKRIGEMLGCDYLVVPTSIAEVYIVPSPDPALRASQAEKRETILQEINQTPTLNGRDEIMSSKVLFYDREAETLTHYRQGPVS